MKLAEKIETAARIAGCENKIKTIDAVIEKQQERDVKNVAVLGETNCGKTTLINKIAGTKVREATAFSLDAKPLVVMFHNDRAEPEYDAVVVNHSRLEEAQVYLYEIPSNMAIDYETRQIQYLLEEMDAIIYIISAVAPFTAADIMNIGAILNKFPIIIYVSKADLLESDEEYGEVITYIQDVFTREFDGASCEILDSRQSAAVDAVIKGMKDISLDELREFHRIRLEQQAKNIVVEELKRQIKQLDIQKEEWETGRAEKDAAYKKQLLQWEELRVEMRERQREAIALTDKRIETAKISAKERLLFQLKETKHKRKWILHELEGYLWDELRQVSAQAAQDLQDKTAADAAWMISEVNRRVGVRISVDDIQNETPERLQEKPDNVLKEPGYHRIAAAAGTGILAGSAVLSGMSLFPTCIVAVPASVLTLYLLREDSEERQQYNERLSQVTEQCCERNFAAFEAQMRTAVSRYYGYMTESIRKYSTLAVAESEENDISERREKLMDMLEKLI